MGKLSLFWSVCTLVTVACAPEPTPDGQPCVVDDECYPGRVCDWIGQRSQCTIPCETQAECRPLGYCIAYEDRDAVCFPECPLDGCLEGWSCRPYPLLWFAFCAPSPG